MASFNENVFIGLANSLRLGDTDSSNYVALKSPGTVSSNLTLTMPSVDGGAGAALVTDGSATLAFAQVFSTMNVQSLSANLTLADTSARMQFVTPVTTDRDVNLPTACAIGTTFYIKNALTTGTLLINVKGGSSPTLVVAGAALGPNGYIMVTATSATPTANTDWKVIEIYNEVAVTSTFQQSGSAASASATIRVTRHNRLVTVIIPDIAPATTAITSPIATNTALPSWAFPAFDAQTLNQIKVTNAGTSATESIATYIAASQGIIQFYVMAGAGSFGSTSSTIRSQSITYIVTNP